MTARPPLARWLSAPARLMLGFALLIAIATAPSRAWSPIAMAGLLALALIVMARPKLVVFAIALGSALAMSIALTLPFFFMHDGAHAARLIARCLAATSIALCVGSTFSELELGAALRWARLPEPLVEVIETLLTELRLIRPLGERMSLARRLRGARGWRAGGELLAGLFVLSAERAERLALGRRLRGYDEVRARSSVRLNWRDIPALLLTLVVAVAVHVAPRIAAL